VWPILISYYGRSFEGLWIGSVDPENNFLNIKTDDNRINLYIPEVEEWVKGITPEAEEEQLQSDGKYPFVLLAGRHMDENANNLMRNPQWNTGRRACSLAMHPVDAERLCISDQQIVRVTTEAGTADTGNDHGHSPWNGDHSPRLWIGIQWGDIRCWR